MGSVLPMERHVAAKVWRLKLAVALGMIRTASALHCTPEEYASLLVQACTDDGDAWKHRFQQLERAVLTLEHRAWAQGAHDSSLEFMDSHQSPNLKVEFQWTKGARLIQSFVTLHGILSSPSFAHPPQNVLVGCVTALLQHLCGNEAPSAPHEVVESIVDTVHKVLDMQLPQDKSALVQCCIEFVDTLLLDIYCTPEINRIWVQQWRSMLIGQLGRHPQLAPSMLNRLLQEVTTLHPSLEQPWGAENMYPVFRAIESLLLCGNGVLLTQFTYWTKKNGQQLLNTSPLYALYGAHLQCLPCEK